MITGRRFFHPRYFSRFILPLVLFLFIFVTLQLLLESKQERKQPVLITSTKWIVITSNNYPTEVVKRLASLKEWTVVVVADELTPKDWTWRGVHFLSIEKQKSSLGLSLHDALPFNSYTRKNIGYLYAIKNGAEWIYDTEDDVKQYGDGLDRFDYSDGETVSGLRYTPRENINEKLFNIYKFFGYQNMWPRGFPLKHLNGHSNGEDRYILCREMKLPVVQHGLVHKDVDVINRFLYGNGKSDFNIHAPTVTLEAGTYSPFNSQNTLFNRRAFFTLFLPTTVSPRVSDIWRSYFTQKLLHLTGESVAFYSVNAVQRRGSNLSSAFSDEIDIFAKSGQLVEFVDNFECSSNVIDKCMIELANGCVNHGFLKSSDIQLIEMWIADLKKIGYKFPVITGGDNMLVNTTGFRSNCRSANLDFLVPGISIHGTGLQKLEYFDDVITWCGDNKKNLPSPKRIESFHSAHPALQDKKDTVIVFMSNSPSKQSIGLIQRLYSPYFVSTIFCGSWNSKDFEHNDLEVLKPVNFINLTEAEAYNGYFSYYCIAKVKELRLRNVKGYYFISEDATFNFWNPLPMNMTLRAKEEYTQMNGVWWNMRIKAGGEIRSGKQAAEKFANLMNFKYSEDPLNLKTWRFYSKLVKENGFPSGREAIQNLTGRIASSFYYIPAKDFDFYANMCETLMEAGVFVEIAHNKILLAVKSLPMENFLYHDWDSKKGKNDKTSLELYDSELTGIHPIKSTEKKEFCSTVVSAFYENLFQFEKI